MPPFPNMTFDLDLWPTDLKINRDHLLMKDYLPTKFEASWAKPSWVISCTRLGATDIPTDLPTYRPTGSTQYAPPFWKRGINMNKHMSGFYVEGDLHVIMTKSSTRISKVSEFNTCRIKKLQDVKINQLIYIIILDNTFQGCIILKCFVLISRHWAL